MKSSIAGKRWVRSGRQGFRRRLTSSSLGVNLKVRQSHEMLSGVKTYRMDIIISAHKPQGRAKADPLSCTCGVMSEQSLQALTNSSSEEIIKRREHENMKLQVLRDGKWGNESEVRCQNREKYARLTWCRQQS